MNQVLSRIPVKMLGDLLSTRALERIFQDAAQMRQLHPAQLDAATVSTILKQDVYRRLQMSVPAQMAKKRVQDVIEEVNRASAEMGSIEYVPVDLSKLEEGVKKYTLYFDWPESQRLRGVLSIARQEEAIGNDVSALIEEGETLIAQMDRRLKEGLVAQAQELAELQATFKRVSGVGGREVRRLETLLDQVADAQKQGMLLPGEVERARKLGLNLRKQLESSVVQAAGEQSGPDQAAQARVQALELEHTARLLGDLLVEFGPLLSQRPELELHARDLNDQLAAGQLTEEAVTTWRTELETLRTQIREQQQADLAALEEGFAALSDTPEAASARVTLGIARHTASEGGLVQSELRDLNNVLRALQSAPEGGAGATLQLQRELSDLERSAREIPGAAEELSGPIEEAREALLRGEDVSLDELYAVLERRMGQAAQQREEYDARADVVIAEYDTVRHLAGETIQKLGRLADALRPSGAWARCRCKPVTATSPR
ncbi:hypothetical protein ACFP81_07900 [Deinococcus lacus]|uniref:Uncharacterized protein n=1 Tax=Deinococcus lacus TaxID=392561 RepID=A0ABW1YCX3_9DEIO